jgi:hypothetical protein
MATPVGATGSKVRFAHHSETIVKSGEDSIRGICLAQLLDGVRLSPSSLQD